jgi:hypothetical protein
VQEMVEIGRGVGHNCKLIFYFFRIGL